jgi:mono/diheme cytochrome c family protein
MRVQPRLNLALSALMAIFFGPDWSGFSQQQAAVPPEHARRMQEGLALFKEHVRPALVRHCLNCHGGKEIKGEFDLSTREALVASGHVELGKASESQLCLVIGHKEEPHMPHKAPKLADETIARIARWIDLGAPYDRPLIERPGKLPARTAAPTEQDRDFWSFRALGAVSPPAVQDAAWVRTSIDRFILAALEKRGLVPNPPADRRTLIRRLYFDVIGLPPPPQEIEAFVQDPSPGAYERQVDRLLASPHLGERWARHWMDVARFAESHGYEQDYDRPHAYHYRDFLIEAINQDMPFDRFVHWQLAGDELDPEDLLANEATGFLGAGAFPTQLTEAEFESARYNELDDMVATTGVAFLGLSVGCARCHDHKYDPIPFQDYYALAATFTTTIRSEIDVTGEKGSKPVKVQVTAEGYPHTKHHADERGFPHFYPTTYVLQRGDVDQKQREAVAGFLSVLTRGGRDSAAWKVDRPPGKNRTSFRRAALARWLTDTEAGAGQLAARVIVNRLWQHHFGRGIVTTPNDFGTQGARPNHPELLDWLATDLVEHGWQLKRLHRLMLISSVFRQDSRFDQARAAIDPDNLYHWRRTPLRLEAEPIRDAMLSVSGLLERRMQGPGSLDPMMRRRSVYFFIKRSQLIPMMMLFDWPEHLVSIGLRATTTTAPQALYFMNSPLARRCAQGFAGRLAGKTQVEAIGNAYRIALGREPSGAETSLATRFLADQGRKYARAGKPEPAGLALVDFSQALMSMSEFLYIP